LIYCLDKELVLNSCCVQEAYTKFSNLENHHCEVLRRLAKLIQDTHVSQEQEAHKQAVSDYEEALDVIM